MTPAAIRAAAAAAILTWAHAAHAELVAVDIEADCDPGAVCQDGIVRDTESGLDWLHLSHSLGLPSVAAPGLPVAGGGWRLARLDEVCGLFEQFRAPGSMGPIPNCPNGSFFGSTSLAQVDAFGSLFGLTSPPPMPPLSEPPVFFSSGFFDDGDPVDPLVGVASADTGSVGFPALFGFQNEASATEPDPSTASFLVRASPLEIPALGYAARMGVVLMLLTTGLASLRRRRPRTKCP